MKVKRLVSLLLSIILAVTLVASLTACGNKTGAYILSDKGTYLAFKKSAEGDKIPNIELLYEQDDALKNTYSMIAVDGDGTGFATPVTLNEKGADCFIKWMSTTATRNLIKDFGKSTYNEALFYLLDTAQTSAATNADLSYASSGASTNVIKVSTTTSVNDTGLLGSLETVFEAATGWDIQVASAGTGAAIQAAKDGNADLLLVHSASQEKAFIDAGYARTVAGLTGTVTDSAYPQRVSFMYNYFVLLGPKNDPAKVKSAESIVKAFELIAEGGYNFVSRGDNSGTHTAEVNLWKKTTVALTTISVTIKDKAATITVPGANNVAAAWYVSAGQGMGACLTMANDILQKDK